MGKVCFNKQEMGCDKVFTPEQLFAKIFHLFIQISSPSQLGVGLEWDRNQQLRQKQVWFLLGPSPARSLPGRSPSLLSALLSFLII